MADKPAPRLKISKIRELLNERNMEEKCVAGLEDCLNATLTIRDEEGKLHVVPDFKTILGAIALGISYTAGKPVEYREILTRNMTTIEDLEKQTQHSPEASRTARQDLKIRNTSPKS